VPRAHIVVGLGFGDEGKGSMVDALVRKTGAQLVVRYNGGAQAGHTVVLPDGRSHSFSQFGAGTFVPGCRTLLSRFMILHPTAALEEEEHLRSQGIADAFERLDIDGHALVITPYHQALNRLRELARGSERHGSCGMGIGETVQDSIEHPHERIYAYDLANHALVTKKLKAIRKRKLQEAFALRVKSTELAILEDDDSLIEIIANRFAALAERVTIGEWHSLPSDSDVVFEGAQGVLLDENYGFHPYTTWSTCTSANALQLLRELDFQGERSVMGVLRGYSTRHGPGPFVAEDRDLSLPDITNHWHPYQRNFRVGWFDLVAARYALAADGNIDHLALTCLDRIEPSLIVTSYTIRGDRVNELMVVPHDLDYQARLTDDLMQAVPCLGEIDQVSKPAQPYYYARVLQKLLRKEVRVLSLGPTHQDKRWL